MKQKNNKPKKVKPQSKEVKNGIINGEVWSNGKLIALVG